ncbi:Gfo/Idh/MocA family oxidoreductase [Maioricimonas sp. JC845]|uniref:Gfo/Idh/MocA family protein n=1 Tax=Maioricimonas sp. JC845 TaxID=3232138 RepID=UPI0034584529
MSDGTVSRRTFLGTTTAAGVSATLSRSATAASGSANERLQIGFIGPGRRGFGAHVRSLVKLHKLGAPIDLVAVNDVYTVHRDRAVDYIEKQTGKRPETFADYRDMLASGKVDAVCIGTPDHWHAKQTIDALQAGLHVYCEKPITHTVAEAMDVVREWKKSGQVLQVGVQSSSSPIWDRARALIDSGRLGKVVQFQTEYFRNSKYGMSRHNEISAQMTPQTIDWRQWLGVDEGLAPEMPFDRAVFGQWRCYWPFSRGMAGDLFVHRVTGMLKATGLRFPGRVVGGGGIFLEYDDRDVPDVNSLIADFHEGVQGVVSSTMVSEELKLDHVIRGHHGSLRFEKMSYGNGPQAAFEFVPERPQVTLNSELKPERIEETTEHDFNVMHFANFLDAVRENRPDMVNNDPVLGAAAVMIVNLAVRSYREGKVYHVDRDGQISDGDSSWADRWEQMSKERAVPRHVPGWQAGDAGSVLHPPAYQKLAGPWIDGNPPEGT